MPWGIDFNPAQSFFGSILRSILGALQALLAFLWNVLVAVYNFLLTLLIAVGNFMLRIFGHVGRFFRNLWDKWIGKGILKLLELYDRLVQKLQRFLEPVLRVLRRIREIIDYWYNRIFGPIIQMIQSVRRVLEIFRIFHLKFAEKLDEKLLRLERKITEPYLILRAKINEVITWLTLGTDVKAIISPHTILGSIARIFGALASLTGGRFNRALTASEEESQRRDATRYTKTRIEAHREEIAKRGLNDDDKRIAAATRKASMEITGLDADSYPATP